jgi:hypothetical protein
VLALGVFDDCMGTGPDLYAGGQFSKAGGLPSAHVARWSGCYADSAAFCFGDDLDPSVTTNCPCLNFGAPGRGCANSIEAAGARLCATGTTTPDTVVLTSSDMPPTALTIFLKGNVNNVVGVVFGDGVRCAGGALIRFGQQNAVGGVSVYPGSFPNTVSNVGGTPPGSGLTGYYQAFYRNAAAGFCPPATFNISNGFRITW